MRVQINLSYPNDPDLTATLFYDMGMPNQISVPLFSSVGHGTNTANFTNTVFDDNAGTPIQSGGAPFFATFNPQKSLSAFAGIERQGNLDARHPERLDNRGHRHVQRLVAELSEAITNHGLGRAGH